MDTLFLATEAGRSLRLYSPISSAGHSGLTVPDHSFVESETYFPPNPLQHTHTLKTSDEKNDMSLQSLKGAHYRLAPPCPKNQI